MSANTVARWNAIPLSRPDSDSQQNNLKRPRPDDQDDNDNIEVDEDTDDDNMPIVSRSPSPPLPDTMDVDKYDEYIKGPAREVITVETKIKPTNKGFSMLSQLGWSEGQPLGLSGDGRVEPIPFQIKRDLTGLGKINQELRMIEAAVSQRRGLDSERQQKETEDQRRAREDNVARRAALQTEISTTLKAFYCELCDKQFKTVAQYDEHTNSYAHHHKARFREMQTSQRMKPQEEVDKRKEKERKREEKELRKIAAAAGVRMAKPTVQLPTLAPSNTSTDSPPVSTGLDPEMTSTGFKKSGWSTLGGGSSSPSPGHSIPEPPTAGSRATASSSTQSAPPPSTSPSAPSFRSASWTSLDTGSSQPVPPSPEPRAPTASVSSPSQSRGSWSSIPPVGASQSRGIDGWNVATVGVQPPPDSLTSSVGASQPRGEWNVVTASPSVGQPPPPSDNRGHPSLSRGQNRPLSPRADPPSRSGWQQFKNIGPKRR